MSTQENATNLPVVDPSAIIKSAPKKAAPARKTAEEKVTANAASKAKKAAAKPSKPAAKKEAVVKPKRVTTPALTIAQVAAVFGKSTMAVFNWRRGTSTREALQPIDETARNPLFRPSVLLKYAKTYGLEIVRDPTEVVAKWDSIVASSAGMKKAKAKRVKAKSSKAADKKSKH